MPGVAYLGPAGTFSHQAARRWAGEQGGLALLPAPDLFAAAQAVLAGQADFAVLPAENSIEGAVNLTLDLLVEEPDLTVCGEIVLAVRHALATRALTAEAVAAVCSHPQALAQCRRFLQARLPAAEVFSVSSTAAAMEKAAADASVAAVGPAFAAAIYGLPLLFDDIQDYADNRTRFLVVRRGGQTPPSGDDKTSLALGLAADRPGSLYRALAIFAGAGVNLTRIESRPTKKVLGEYYFFLDCEGHAASEPLRGALAELSRSATFLRVLGSYPRARGEGHV